MTMLDKRELEKRMNMLAFEPRPSMAEQLHIDLRRSLIHEHGHFVVAAHYGIRGWVSIRRNDTGGDEEVHYIGSFHFMRGSMPTARSIRLVGLAGVAAEMLDENPDTNEDDLNDATMWGPDGSFSDTDCGFAGKFTWRDLAGVLKLLRRYWPELMNTVERELAHAS